VWDKKQRGGFPDEADLVEDIIELAGKAGPS